MERYEKIARQEWEKLHKVIGSDKNLDPHIKPHAWDYWKKAFEICMANYRWEDIDMYNAFAQGQLDVLDREVERKSNESVRKLKDHQEWLKEYEQYLQTEQTTNSWTKIQ